MNVTAESARSIAGIMTNVRMPVITSLPPPVVYPLYGALFTIGVGLNSAVLHRMFHFRLSHREQYSRGTGVCITVLATSDLLCLISLAGRLLLSLLYRPGGIAEQFLSLLGSCAYAETMWCWCYMSAMRYLATTRPLEYAVLKGRQSPCSTLGALAVMALMGNAWPMIFRLCLNGDYGDGARAIRALDRMHTALETLFSFLLPATLVLFMDTAVALDRVRRHRSSDPMLQVVINHPSGGKKRLFPHFIVITAAVVTANLPATGLIRPLEAFGATALLRSTPRVVIETARFLFYTQFAFKAFYVQHFVYDKSLPSKSANSSRHLSISVRCRLEENGHLLRPRANTFTYRPTTPVAPMFGGLARNCSCAAFANRKSLTTEMGTGGDQGKLEVRWL